MEDIIFTIDFQFPNTRSSESLEINSNFNHVGVPISELFLLNSLKKV